jgi:hypothetical protein
MEGGWLNSWAEFAEPGSVHDDGPDLKSERAMAGWL